MIVWDNRAAQFVADAVGCSFEQPFTCMGWERDGVITCGVIFNCFTDHDVEMSAAGRPTRAMLRAVAAFVFDYHKRRRISISTESTTVAALAVRLGARVEGLKRSFYGPGRDAILLGILKDEWVIK